MKLETEGYFKISSVFVKVDWEKCLTAYALRDDQFNHDWNNLALMLRDLRVLTYKAAGSFMIQQDGSQFCFHLFGSSLYFTNRSNALGFIEAYKNQYGDHSNLAVLHIAQD